MSDTKFTPGPWVVADSLDFDNVSVVMDTAIDNPSSYITGNVWACDLWWDECDEEDIANAHLISAAPDMYEALEELLQLIEIERPDWQHTEQHRGYKALKKARGEI